MGEFSLAHILVVALVAIVLFGRGKVSSIMGEFGRGISSFKQGLRDDSQTVALPAAEPAEVTPSKQA